MEHYQYKVKGAVPADAISAHLHTRYNINIAMNVLRQANMDRHHNILRDGAQEYLASLDTDRYHNVMIHAWQAALELVEKYGNKPTEEQAMQITAEHLAVAFDYLLRCEGDNQRKRHWVVKGVWKTVRKVVGRENLFAAHVQLGLGEWDEAIVNSGLPEDDMMKLGEGVDPDSYAHLPPCGSPGIPIKQEEAEDYGSSSELSDVDMEVLAEGDEEDYSSQGDDEHCTLSIKQEDDDGTSSDLSDVDMDVLEEGAKGEVEELGEEIIVERFMMKVRGARLRRGP